MARIKQIIFSHTGKQEGCTCDRCGQYITNVWTVFYSDNVVLHFGIDCYERICKESKLTAYGIKLMKKSMKTIQFYCEQLERWKNGEINEDSAEWQNLQVDSDWNQSYWKGRSFEEYKDWNINEFFPHRIERAQQEFEEKFKKVNFVR